MPGKLTGFPCNPIPARGFGFIGATKWRPRVVAFTSFGQNSILLSFTSIYKRLKATVDLLKIVKEKFESIKVFYGDQ